MAVRVEDWLQNQSVCVARGPLVYSLKIVEKRVEHTNDPPEIKPFLEGHEIQGFPEVEFLPESDWRYGFAKGFNARQVKVVESGMNANPFVEETVPVHLELPLCPLPGWAAGAEATPDLEREPSGLPNARELAAARQPVVITMVPYGSTHLRLTTLPVVVER